MDRILPDIFNIACKQTATCSEKAAAQSLHRFLHEDSEPYGYIWDFRFFSFMYLFISCLFMSEIMASKVRMDQHRA